MSKNESNTKFTLGFVGVGFPRCGTTWVAECLKKHPQVDFSTVKETNYFCSANNPTLVLGGNPFKVQNYDEYVGMYSNNGNITGEFSTNYINDPSSIKKISKKFPNAKIIVCLRAPTEALYSTFWYLKNSHRSNELPPTIKDGIYNQTPLFTRMVDTFKYNKHLKNLFKYFNKDQIHIIYYADIVNNKKKVIKDLYKFLNIDSSFIPKNYNQKVNSLTKSRFSFVNNFVSYFIKLLRFFRLQKFYYYLIVKFPFITKFYNRVFRSNQTKEPLDIQTKRDLYKFYSESVEKLEKTLNKDLSHWKVS